MLGKRITVDGEKYILGAYLASGLIGTVFPAWKEDDTEKTPVYAVKIPASNLSEQLQRRFWEEFDTITILNQKWGQVYPNQLSPFPLVKKATRETGAVEALVMEYVPDEKILSRVVSQIETAFEREKEYIEAAMQYARVLDVLHQAGYTCPDRKTPDVRWVAGEKRLIVLDWNVVAEKTPENILQDYYLFGSMWHQFLTGRYPVAAFILDDDYWGQVSIGARVLVNKLLSRKFSSDDDVMVTTKDLITHSKQDVSVLADEALQVLGGIQLLEKQIVEYLEGRNSTMPDVMFSENDMASLTLIDLAWRIGGDDYLSKRDKIKNVVLNRPAKLTYYAQMALLQGRYDDGLTSLYSLQKRIKDEDVNLNLTIIRWKVLLQVAVNHKQSFRDVGRILSEWLAKFESISNTEQNSAEFWEQQKQKFPRDLLSFDTLLKAFWDELQLRERWASYQKLISAEHFANNQYLQARDILDSIHTLLQEVKSYDQEYAKTLLRVVLPGIEKQANEIEKKVKAEIGKSKSVEEEVGSIAVSMIMRYLHYRIQDAYKLDDWKNTFSKSVEKLQYLDECLQPSRYENIGVQDIANILVELLEDAIWPTLDKDFQKTILQIFYFLPFSTDSLKGFREMLSVAQLLDKKKNIALAPQHDIEHIQLSYLHKIFSLAEKVDVGTDEYQLLEKAYIKFF